MPFACYHSMVAAITENLRKSSNSLVQIAFIAGHASLGSSGVFAVLWEVLTGKIGPFDEVSEAGYMMIGACEYHGSRG